jgi:ParB family transcriptional regulator, chromosome partitioning protein
MAPRAKNALAEIDQEISRLGIDLEAGQPARRRGPVIPITEQVRAVAMATGEAYEALRAEVERSIAEGRTIVELHVDAVVETAWRDRDDGAFVDEAFHQLVRSIRKEGQIAPVTVRPTHGGRYEVVFGHRRVRACRALARPVRAIVVELDDGALLRRMIAENAVRQDLSPLEKARAWQRLLASKTLTRQELADLLEVTAQQVSNVLTLGFLPERVIGALGDWRTLSIAEGKRLVAALQRAGSEVPDGVLEWVSGLDGTASRRARALQEALRASPTPTGSLSGSPADPMAAARGRMIRDRNGRKLAWFSRSGSQAVLRFQSDLDADLIGAFVERLPEFLDLVARDQDR